LKRTAEKTYMVHDATTLAKRYIFVVPDQSSQIKQLYIYILLEFPNSFFFIIVGRGNLSVRFNKTQFGINQPLEAVNMLTHYIIIICIVVID